MIKKNYFKFLLEGDFREGLEAFLVGLTALPFEVCVLTRFSQEFPK